MQGILVNISNHPTLGLLRKVEVLEFRPSWRDEIVEVWLSVKHYNLDGTKINSPSINDYLERMIASNLRRVDPSNGMECYEENIGTEEEPVIIYKRLDNNQEIQNTIGQFDFFDFVIRNQPVNVGQMLTNFIIIDDTLKNRYNK